MKVIGLLLVTLLISSTALAGSAAPPRQTQVVDTGDAPCGIASRAGSVWIGVYETGRLLKLDDRNGREQATVDIGRWACRVAVGPAAVWVTRDRAGELVRVSRGSGRVERIPVGTGTFDVLLAYGSVWTTSYDHAAIVRIEPSARRPERLYKHGPYPAGIASCGAHLGRTRAGRDVGHVDRPTDEPHAAHRGRGVRSRVAGVHPRDRVGEDA